MFSPGDVIEFWSNEAGKRKYHLCISLNGHYLFINSPKGKTFPGNFTFSCGEMPFLTPTPTGESIVSCTYVMRFSPQQLKRMKARKKGSVSVGLLRNLLEFVENTPVLSQEDKDTILDGIGDWV